MSRSNSKPVQLELQYLTTCTTDYFEGSNLPVVQVLVDENSTYQSIKEDLTSHIATCHLQDSCSPFSLLDGRLSEYNEAVEQFFKERCSPIMHLVPSQLVNVGSMEDEEDWDLYMYFTLKDSKDA